MRNGTIVVLWSVGRDPIELPLTSKPIGDEKGTKMVLWSIGRVRKTFRHHSTTCAHEDLQPASHTNVESFSFQSEFSLVFGCPHLVWIL